jgi:light-regulated signal transduction histidine kinase (bacteriophytochrome)
VGRKDKPFEKIDLNHLMEETLQDFEELIKESGVKIEVESNMPTIFGIRFRIKQLLHNLISNSIKFRKGDDPKIEIGCCVESSDDYWLFYIKDNGIGIESEYYDRIFGIFKRLYSREEYPGIGIGLALCKRIVETHGGEIWVDSDKDNGTYFYFTISKCVTMI